MLKLSLLNKILGVYYENGITFIEVITLISIFGILVSIALSGYKGHLAQSYKYEISWRHGDYYNESSRHLTNSYEINKSGCIVFINQNNKKKTRCGNFTLDER